MKLIILIFLLSLFLAGCISHNPLLIQKCNRAKDMTVHLMDDIDIINEFNAKHESANISLSYVYDVKEYNELCGDITGKLELR